MMIDAYVIEQKSKTGEWVNAGLKFGASGGKVFGGDPKAARELKYVTFESAIENKNILPHETVRGWLFLTLREVGELRLKIFDASGECYTQPIEPKAMGGTAAQPLMFDIIQGVSVDISELPRSSE